MIWSANYQHRQAHVGGTVLEKQFGEYCQLCITGWRDNSDRVRVSLLWLYSFYIAALNLPILIREEIGGNVRFIEVENVGSLAGVDTGYLLATIE
jgi:hypothetical protein